MKKLVMGLAILIGLSLATSAFSQDYCAQADAAPLKWKATKMWNCACSQFAQKNRAGRWVYDLTTPAEKLVEIRSQLQAALQVNNDAAEAKAVAPSPNSIEEIRARIQRTIGVIDDFLRIKNYKEQTTTKENK